MYNQSNSTEDLVNILGLLAENKPFLAIILCLLGLAALWRIWVKRNTKSSIRNIPLLLSDSIDDDLMNGYTGKTPSGMQFIYFLSGLSLFSSRPTRGIYSIELPFTSGVHLVGVPVRSGVSVGINTSSLVVEPVVLEGDYPNYFHLYADFHQQMQSRYVLDPKAMEFTIDFCRNFHWEIVEDTLYFMSEGHLPSFEVVDQFVNEIRPAIEIPSSRYKNPARLPYTHITGRTFKCPICSMPLIEGEQWLECPQDHGCLVTGGQLSRLRKGAGEGKNLRSIDTATTKAVEHVEIRCPYCSNVMIPSKYQLTSTIIDICSKCMYRWLDTGELKNVLAMGYKIID